MSAEEQRAALWRMNAALCRQAVAEDELRLAGDPARLAALRAGWEPVLARDPAEPDCDVDPARTTPTN